MSLLALIGAASVLAGAPPRVLQVPAASVGDPPVEGSVLRKLDELAGSTLARAGAGSPAAAADPGLSLVERAKSLYVGLDFAGALRSAEEAVAHYRAHPEHLGDGRPILDSHVYAALALLELGRKEESQRQLSLALTLRPDLQLSEAEFSPVALLAVERARSAHLAGRAKAPLTLTTAPAFSQLWVDGKPAGEAPLALSELPVGWHFVRASKEGHSPQSAWVELTAKGAQLSLTLPRAPAAVAQERLREAIVSGRGAEVAEHARSLAQLSGADAVLLLAVSSGERLAATAALVTSDGRSTRSFSTLRGDLLDAPAVLDALVRSTLEEDRGSTPRGVGEAGVAARFDFGRHFMGFGPPAAPVVDFTPPPPAPSAPRPLWANPWAWAAAGAIAVAAGGGVYLLNRPPPPKPGTILDVSLP